MSLSQLAFEIRITSYHAILRTVTEPRPGIGRKARSARERSEAGLGGIARPEARGGRKRDRIVSTHLLWDPDVAISCFCVMLKNLLSLDL